MTGKAAMPKPAQHIPTYTPAGHADGQFGFRAEGLPPTGACRVRTAHQTVDHLGRSRQRPQMMIAVVADIHGTVTERTRAFLDIKINPCEDGPCRPTIRHGGSTLVLKLVDDSRRVPTITYAKRVGQNLAWPWDGSLKKIGGQPLTSEVISTLGMSCGRKRERGTSGR